MKMNKTFLRIGSVIFGLASMAAVGFLVTVRPGSGGGFLDLSNWARTLYCVAAVFFASLSVVSWKTTGQGHRKTKVFVWAAVVTVIIVITIICSFYRVPAVEPSIAAKSLHLNAGFSS